MTRAAHLERYAIAGPGLVQCTCARPPPSGPGLDAVSARRWEAPLPPRTVREAPDLDEPEPVPASGAIARPDIAQRAVFEVLIRPFLPQIYRVCLALCRDGDEASDLLQNSLVKAFTHAESFQGKSDLFAWICGIVRNEHMESVRTRLRRWSLLDRVLEGCSAALGTIFTGGTEEPSPEERAIHSQQWDTLLVCMRSLPEDHRMVLLLCDVEELGYERVAQILEVPVGTVKSRHARGRARLKEAFLEWEAGMAAKEER